MIKLFDSLDILMLCFDYFLRWKNSVAVQAIRVKNCSIVSLKTDWTLCMLVENVSLNLNIFTTVFELTIC